MRETPSPSPSPPPPPSSSSLAQGMPLSACCLGSRTRRHGSFGVFSPRSQHSCNVARLTNCASFVGQALSLTVTSSLLCSWPECRTQYRNCNTDGRFSSSTPRFRDKSVFRADAVDVGRKFRHILNGNLFLGHIYDCACEHANHRS